MGGVTKLIPMTILDNDGIFFDLNENSSVIMRIINGVKIAIAMLVDDIIYLCFSLIVFVRLVEGTGKSLSS